MPMYQQLYHVPTTLAVNTSVPGDTLETKVERLMHTKEPLGDPGAPLIYTERAEGIRASTNIRTDRWEIAIEATEKIAKSFKARREERAAKREADRKAKQNEPETKEPAKQEENKA